MEKYYIYVASNYIELTIIDDDIIYPLTIVTDRYCGAYTGGKYLAFPLYNFCNLVTDDFDDNTILIDKESPFFPQRFYGVGDTPNEALDDLKKLAREGGYYKPVIDNKR